NSSWLIGRGSERFAHFILVASVEDCVRARCRNNAARHRLGRDDTVTSAESKSQILENFEWVDVGFKSAVLFAENARFRSDGIQEFPVAHRTGDSELGGAERGK